jgi:hypothetical protein
MAQLFGGQHGQHIGLVLVGVDGTTQSAVGKTRIVAAGDGVEAKRQCTSCQRGELDSLVAPHARVGCFAAGIRRHEVVDHVFFEAVGEIPYVERDIENIGDASSVTGVFLRAAAPRSGAQRARRCRQR